MRSSPRRGIPFIVAASGMVEERRCCRTRKHPPLEFYPLMEKVARSLRPKPVSPPNAMPVTIISAFYEILFSPFAPSATSAFRSRRGQPWDTRERDESVNSAGNRVSITVDRGKVDEDESRCIKKSSCEGSQLRQLTAVLPYIKETDRSNQ